jgi:hypothetical protein
MIVKGSLPQGACKPGRNKISLRLFASLFNAKRRGGFLGFSATDQKLTGGEVAYQPEQKGDDRNKRRKRKNSKGTYGSLRKYRKVLRSRGLK